MRIVTSILLGTLQGLTEFLPVSSSGHLVIAQKLIPNFSQPGVLFEVILHAGTLSSILFYFRKSIAKLNSNYLKMILVGTIPAGLVGFFFQSQIENIFANVKIVGFALFVTAVMNFLTETKSAHIIGTFKGLTLAAIVGLFQALALIPGISRSGSTIFAGAKSGFKKSEAAKFSFLLSIPAIIGANILQIAKYGIVDQTPLIEYFWGFLAAFISGYFAISLVFKSLQNKEFTIFGVYCFLLGTVVLIFS